MMIVERNISVFMARDHLDGLPDYSLPPGYRLTWYRPGDADLWVDIQARSDRYNTITLDLFRRSFGADDALLAQRQVFLRDEQGAAVGTASAWFDGSPGPQAPGRVHWVAIVPEQQGRGLAKPLLSAVCHRLRELGHRRAVLDTSTARVPAINLYHGFGFRPDIHGSEDAEAWRELQPLLKRPLNKE